MWMLLVALAQLGSVPAAEMPEIVAPEVLVTIAPSWMDSVQLLKRKTPETYTCTVRVRDGETKGPALAAELVLVPNQSDRVTRVFGDYTLEFAVTLRGDRAETSVTVKRGEKLLTRQRSTVYVKLGSERIVPLR